MGKLVLLGLLSCAHAGIDLLLTLNGSHSNPSEHFENIGTWIEVVSDQDGDGLKDFAVSSPDLLWPNPVAGEVKIISSASSQTIRRIVQQGVNSDFGKSMAEISDMDGDGRGDLLISHGSFTTCGAEVYSSQSGLLIPGTLISDPMLQIPGVVSSVFGENVVNIGDVFDSFGQFATDGFDDFAISSSKRHSQFGPSSAWRGYVFLYSGANLSQPAFVLNGNPALNGTSTALENYGQSVVNIGDINGDGRPELAIGAPSTLSPHSTPKGYVVIYSGANFTPMITLEAPGDRELFGASIAGVGDLNGDGTLELAIGAPGANSTQGKVYVYSLSAQQATLLALAELPPASPYLNASLGGAILDYSPNANPTDMNQDQVIDSALDLNGDGIGDLIVGMPSYSPWETIAHPISNAGGLAIFYGNKPDSHSYTLNFTKVMQQGHSVFDSHPDILMSQVPSDGDSFGQRLRYLGGVAGRGARIAIGTPSDNFDSPGGSTHRGSLIQLEFMPDLIFDEPEISISQAPVVRTADLHAGERFQGHTYWLLGSTESSSTIPIPGSIDLFLPFADDGSLFSFTANHPNTGALHQTLSILNGNGSAQSVLSTAANIVPGVSNIFTSSTGVIIEEMTFSYLVLSPNNEVVYVSDPATLKVSP